MADFLLELGQNPQARNLIKTLGLPLPMPQSLARAKGPMEERPLFDHAVAIGASEGSSLLPTVAETLAAAGADPFLIGPHHDASYWQAPGEAYGRPADVHAGAPTGFRPQGLLFDASGVSSGSSCISSSTRGWRNSISPSIDVPARSPISDRRPWSAAST